MHKHRAAQHRLAGQAVTAQARSRPAIEVGGDAVEQFGVRVELRRCPFQFVGDGVVKGLGIE